MFLFGFFFWIRPFIILVLPLSCHPLLTNLFISYLKATINCFFVSVAPPKMVWAGGQKLISLNFLKKKTDILPVVYLTYSSKL